MIELKSISATYHRGTSRETCALHPMRIEIPDRQFVVIVGSNGSGKSTILNLVAGSLFPDAGQVLIDGNEVTRLRDYERSRWVARVFQDPVRGTAAGLSILDNFRLAALRSNRKGLRLGSGSAFRERIFEKVKALGLGLEGRLDLDIGSLSGGQRQALTLSMAMLDQPAVLLLDEPAAALDPRTSENLMSTAARMIASSGVTTLLVTHNMKEAARYGDRVLLMCEGTVARDLSGDDKKAMRVGDLYSWFD